MPVRDPLQSKGTVFRSYVETLRRKGWLEDVKQRTTAETKGLIEHLPLASVWMDTTPSDDLLAALAAAHGLDACRVLGHDAIEGPLMVFLKPIVRGVMRIVGTTPHALYEHLDRIITLSAKPYSATYERLGDKSGRVTLLPGRPITEPGWHLWRGILGVAFDLCRVEGVVDLPIPSPDKTSFSVLVRWH